MLLFCEVFARRLVMPVRGGGWVVMVVVVVYVFVVSVDGCAHLLPIHLSSVAIYGEPWAQGGSLTGNPRQALTTPLVS